MGNANSFTFADVECAFQDSLLLGSWFYAYCLILLVLPIFMAAFLVVGYCILHVCLWSKKEQKSKQEHIIAEKYGTGDLVERGKFARGKKRISSVPLCSQLINICIITMYLVWSWCSLCILQVMFDCSDKGDGQGVRRLSFDVKEVCYRPGTAHRTFLIFVGMPGFLVYVVGAPLAVGTILFRVRNRLGDQIVLNRYGFYLLDIAVKNFTGNSSDGKAILCGIGRRRFGLHA